MDYLVVIICKVEVKGTIAIQFLYISKCGLFIVKPINGNYGPWSTWTLCSKSCGGGVRSRVRNCTNPAPAFGGMDCSALGEPQESEPCKTRQICPGQCCFYYSL